MLTRTIRIQLKPTPEQVALLRQTMQEYTACFNEVCQLADTEKISNGVDLHRLTYANQRATTHLPSQLICAARVKATEAIKSVRARRKKQVKRYQQRLKEAQKTDKPVKPLKLAKTPHSQVCAIRYDARSFRFDRDRRVVSLKAVSKGVSVEFVDARYSSQCCSRCGSIDKRNRVCQSEFSCKRCGYRANADYNASVNLARRAKSATSGLAVKEPLVSD